MSLFQNPVGFGTASDIKGIQYRDTKIPLLCNIAKTTTKSKKKERFPARDNSAPLYSGACILLLIASPKV
jgi:hypothetical protein